MFKAIFLITGFCSILFGCDIRKNDKQAAIKTAQPEIKDPTTVQVIDSVFDFGKINEGEDVEFKYRFKNTGSKPLVVSDAHASCGCTVPEKPEKPVMPGETGYIKVKFNSDKRPGEAHKTVTVSSNANPPFPQLLLKGTVIGRQ
jgi:hypothetical protein